MLSGRTRALLVGGLSANLIAVGCAHRPPAAPPPVVARVATINIPAGTHATIFVDKRGQIIDVLDETDKPALKKELKNQQVKFSDESGFDRFETITIFFTHNPHKWCTATSGGSTFKYPCH
jgi:hypothetical protein